MPNRTPRGPALAALIALAAVGLAGAARAAMPTPARAPRASTRDNPMAPFTLPRAGEFALRGTVLEHVDAGRYVYLRVHDDAGRDAWVVTLRRAASTQGRVDAWVVARAASFASPRLHRRFAPLFFGIVRAEASAPTAQEGHPR